MHFVRYSLAIVCLSFVPMPVMAHAVLEKASPVAGQNLNAGPEKVELHFSEALESAFSGAAITDASGHSMAAGTSIVAGSQIVLPLKALLPGRYRVSWHAVSLDAHRTDGAYNFSVAAGAPPAVAAPPLVVRDAWLRALPAGLPAGGYFTLTNPTARTVTLIGASSPSCGMLMLHKSDMMSGMASMSEVESIDIPPGATVKFAPGGYHLMCTKPVVSIKPGSKIAVMLEFGDGTHLSVTFDVRGANGK